MKQKIVAFLGAILIGMGGLCYATPVMAADGDEGATGSAGCDRGFLGFRPWYQGVCQGSGADMEIVAPDATQMTPEVAGQELGRFVWTIVLNIVFDITLAIGYIAVGLVIYGGYLYIMSQGDPGKAAKGQSTLISATIGAIIAVGASVIVNTVTVILGINRYGGLQQGFNADNLKNIFSWAYSMAGLVAVIFIIRGGIEFIVSKGDPGRVQKATHSITYAVIGLIIVLLAALITNLVIGAISGATA